MTDSSMIVEDMVNEEAPKQKPIPVKRGRGRPRKVANVEPVVETPVDTPVETPVAKQDDPVPEPETPVKRGRGRPRKVVDPNAPVKPKRKCTEAQLKALAEGRKKNSRFHPKNVQ